MTVGYDDDDALYESLEVRVLGPLRVRRADGTVVQPAEWLSSQTADLLRLLALHVNEPVAVDDLVQALWPKADEARGRASLRNSASRLRRVLGEDCVQRRLGSFVLTGAWVDAQAFRNLARQARREMVAGAFAQVVTTAREAEAVYLGEFRTQNEGAEWGLRERDALAAMFRTVLVDAAEAAQALGWWHDAVGFAERTLLLEPCSERAFRALMSAQHGLGETALALKTYDRCRRALAEDVGADPSAETRELHLRLLADEPVVVDAAPFSGRSHESQWLQEIVETAAATGEPTMVCVTGAPHAGKTRLVEHAVAAVDAPLRTVTCAASRDPWPDVLSALEDLGAGVPPVGAPAAVPRGDVSVVLVDDVHLLPDTGVDQLGERLPTLCGPVCVVLAGRSPDVDAPAQRLARRWGARGSLLAVPPLGSEEVAELCTALLHGEVSTQLADDVVQRTGGLAGSVVPLVREWAAAGRIAATGSGLVVLNRGAAAQTDVSLRQLLVEAVAQLPAAALDLLHLVAVIGRPVTVEVLLPLTSALGLATGANDFRWLRSTLDHLTDLALLTSTEAGLAPRDPLFNDLVLTWLRPSVRRQLHRKIAERAYISSAERVEHWTRAGEPQLARAAAMDAAADAAEEHQHERARLYLRRLCHASEETNATPADRAELYEHWGDAAALLGRMPEARAAYATAAATAWAHELPDHARLDAKCRGVMAGTPLPATDPAPAPSSQRPEPPRPRVDLSRTPGAPAGRPASSPSPSSWPSSWSYPGGPTPGDLLEEHCEQAIRDADALGDPDVRAAARIASVWDVGIPQRRFRAVRRTAMQALELAQDPAVQAQALAAGWLAAALVGDASAVEPLPDRALGACWGDVLGAGDAALLAVRCLVAHDLGGDDLGVLMRAAAQHGLLRDPLSFQWLGIRLATERGDLAEALEIDGTPTPSSASPLVRALRACASGALAMELGRSEDAQASLVTVLEQASGSGVTLPVPEAAARQVVLLARDDPPSARRWFDLFEESLDGQEFPRETVLKLIARAAMRSADGRPADAAAAAAGAAHTAERAGLVHLAALAHRHRAIHLAAAGNVYEARLAAAAETRWRRHGGLDALSRMDEPETEVAVRRPLPLRD
ncbi:BTAD domain-containing putative transcriptional regulator [Cellulomonas aerilata]|uniref:Bacterial transcriptional activator domain-containing protein n=1 Tax=Cellulomonas aerilata TaxID=515326 RepID=A0A512DA38_9CELL|nr:BTAD domain-containing putative transcriptional regulator [Cellulomonas aerilata]GEO33336.1 hypothetical protein CAE01nite_10610 [Cellulomonas aerilata]